MTAGDIIAVGILSFLAGSLVTMILFTLPDNHMEKKRDKQAGS